MSYIHRSTKGDALRRLNRVALAADWRASWDPTECRHRQNSGVGAPKRCAFVGVGADGAKSTAFGKESEMNWISKNETCAFPTKIVAPL